MASVGDALTWITVLATGCFVAILLGGMAYTIHEDVLASRLQRELAARALATEQARSQRQDPPLTGIDIDALLGRPSGAARGSGALPAAQLTAAVPLAAIGPVRLRQAAPEVVEVLRGVGFSTN